MSVQSSPYHISPKHSLSPSSPQQNIILLTKMHTITLLLTLLLPLIPLAHSDQTKLFTRGPAFANHPKPTFNITSPELGASGSTMPVEYSVDGAGLFPALSWRPPPAVPIEEYVLISEDPDAPVEEPIVHGVYFGIPPVFTGVNHADFQIDESTPDAFRLTGGFRYGENRGGDGVVYLAPAPVPGGGPHRYFFQLVALSRRVDRRMLSDLATRGEVARQVEGAVVGWAEWVGVLER